MKLNKIIGILFFTAFFLTSCSSEKKKNNTQKTQLAVTENKIAEDSVTASCSPRILKRNKKNGLIPLTKNQLEKVADNAKKLDANLPVIGLLMYDDVLITELTAPMDVFTKHSEKGEKLFNVITIAETYDFIVGEEGLKMFPDYTIKNSPKLDVLIVPSAYDMSRQVKNKNLVDFIKAQNNNTEYTVSNCAGAHLIGESGIADGRKIVTWIGGGEDLQKNYPNLKVQDDAVIGYVEDGKFLSSNGNLVSYISSLELLEKMTSAKHREHVESYLFLDRLKNWKK
ncbi:transcriptional regulator GlxA family with amidase domain [Mesonia hippocampi]|uniref:Transcriptional regulator GlxA family with amidase domain n=1 Tax=Mesonia hippocampi TaxID=1628250 RepID=A0A840ER56_9FLAO|nr:DJ-1/PfpI family protein [Mesonia hippocampi]MBB4119521.1 transcriptional regulator GlxA family with amidase domain [Mesonia hippocampi]